MSEHSDLAYPIPKLLWESLDAVLFSKGIQLARDIAAELNVPVQPLLQTLKIQEKTKFVLLPDEETTKYQCQALNQYGLTWLRCRCPVLGCAPRLCSSHCSEKYLKTPCLDNCVEVQRVIINEQTYLRKASDLYSLEGIYCGYIRNSSAVLFEIE